jgi:hypothetical protein
MTEVPSLANARNVNSDVFLRIFGRADAYVSPKWSCGSARQRMEKSCPEEKLRPSSTAWKLGASTGVVTNREEGRQGEPKERQGSSGCGGAIWEEPGDARLKNWRSVFQASAVHSRTVRIASAKS